MHSLQTIASSNRANPIAAPKCPHCDVKLVQYSDEGKHIEECPICWHRSERPVSARSRARRFRHRLHSLRESAVRRLDRQDRDLWKEALA
jgi:uncharacterized Zn finger protein (UPF0148 family)